MSRRAREGAPRRADRARLPPRRPDGPRRLLARKDATMCFIAANATGKGAIALPVQVARRAGQPPCHGSFVEDLNWPIPLPQKKPQRFVEVWAPGPVGT